MIPFLLLVLDQFIKALIRLHLSVNEVFFDFGLFGIVRFENTVGPFSLPIHRDLLLFAHGLVLIVLLVAFYQVPRHRYGILWILFGGLSNFLDRIIFRSTTDYFLLPFNGYWNLADILILIGIILIIFKKSTSPQEGA